ncbi:ABC transporter ATP-binding protein [Lapillicoccus jejuensis]|uniref:ABC-2 type transport system ATP-binding protein n=1 Tax=Lapillicoccus jejuensis TaxID=402171 RepID=A0A542DVZ0_9MICO|nr:ABC transporter ATP-binding protein [Lapillicoccus jejuensis]TQJ07257.1 ABC-2 type transport system ATP-binding protein [Lapillicoccus jejuensis]
MSTSPTGQANPVTPATTVPAPVAPPDDAEVLVRATGVSKRFASYSRRATSLKERLVKREQTEAADFWALQGIDLQVRRGETVGLMGPNGSGKSTLLKVLSGILRPTAGEVQVTGRVASLLELGAGFDGELTGRENIYLNASLLGISRAETDRLFDEIVEFSELGEFIEFPVKHYSSGMYVRLGFAVAVHIDPDILIIDEVLAVGDAAFQQKCLTRIADFQKAGKTILFVSHSSSLVEELCTRAVLLSHGHVLFDGRPGESTTRLNALLGIDRLESEKDGLVTIASMDVRDPSSGESLETFACGASVEVHAEIEWHQPLAAGADLSLHLTAPGIPDPVVVIEPDWTPVPREQLDAGRTTIRWVVEALPDLPGDYSLVLAVFSQEILVGHGRIGGIRLEGATARTVPGRLVYGEPGARPSATS